MQLEWDEQKYTTGFPHIDEQHRELFDGLNGLIAFLKQSSVADQPGNKEKLIQVLDFLGEYAVNHFRDEEEIFDRYDHSMAEANKEAHQAFLAKYTQYQEKLSKDTFTRGALIQLHIFLRSWLLNHIVKIDTALCECAEEAAEELQMHVRPMSAAGGQGVFARFLALFAM